MDVLYERCAGLDIHKKIVVACVIVPGSKGRPVKEIRSFGTMTGDLMALSDWLAAHEVTHVAMESTGVYWKPIWNLLENRFELLLANPRHMKALPGRKTDVKDCEWIADLLRHGLLRASFVPDRFQRELRELTGYRTRLIEERTAEVNRLQSTLEGANIKLASVASDSLGVSGRAILQALLAGTTDPALLAKLAKGKLREKIPELQRALTGQFGAHQRFMIAEQLAHIDFLDEAIQRTDAEVEEQMHPFESRLEQLDAITGVGRRTAQELVAQMGTDMSRFPSHRHCASWAGMCPGNNESAGKRKSGKTRKGNKALRRILVVAARAAGRSKNTYLSAQYHRLAPRRGKNKAAVAVGHSILIIAYHILRDATPYLDLGPRYFDLRDRQRLERRLVRRLEALGNKVILQPEAA